MKTKFNIQVEPNDIDEELKTYITTKLRHVAEGITETAVKEYLDKIVKERVEKVVERSGVFDSYRFKQNVELEVKKQFDHHDMTLKKFVRECFEEIIKEMDLTAIIEHAVENRVKFETSVCIREKVFNAIFGEPQKNEDK